MIKQYILIFLIINNVSAHFCNAMETVPAPLLKEILFLSIIHCPNYTESRQTMLSTSLVCKEWCNIINAFSEKEYDSIITMLAEQEQKNAVCIAAFIGTQQAPNWLKTHLKTFKNLEDAITLQSTLPKSYIPNKTRKIIQQFLEDRGYYCYKATQLIMQQVTDVYSKLQPQSTFAQRNIEEMGEMPTSSSLNLLVSYKNGKNVVVGTERYTTALQTNKELPKPDIQPLD